MHNITRILFVTAILTIAFVIDSQLGLTGLMVAGIAMDLQSFTVTAPGAAPGTAMAAVTGDSLFLRNARAGTDILCLAMWTNGQVTNGRTRMLVPSGHDFVVNWTYRNIAGQPDNKVPYGFPLHFKPQDPLSLTQVGSAVAGDVETVHMLNWYEDLPGVEGNFINPAELRRRGINMLTVEDTTTATGASAYSGSRAINAAADQFKADTEYAIVGAHIGANCGSLCVQGVDFGNLRVGIPGLSGDANWTKDWFLMLSEMHGVPGIPVINSANRGGVFITNVTNENLTAVPFSLVLVQLAPRPVKTPETLTQVNA